MIEHQALHTDTIPTLARAFGRLTDEQLKQLDVRGGGVVTSLLGDENEVWLGKPQVFDLVDLFQLHGRYPSDKIGLQAADADFLLVQFACSFRPAAECEFIRASVRVWLEPAPPSRPDDAIAYDMYPDSIEQPVKVKRTFSIAPELTLKFAGAELSTSGAKHEQAHEYITYEPDIVMFGLGERAPGWDFNKTKARSIRGSRELFMLVKKAKGATLNARFDIHATLQTNIGRIPLSTFFLSGGTKPLVSEHYRLSP